MRTNTPYWRVAAWSLAVLAVGSTVAALGSRALAQISASKTSPALVSQAQAAMPSQAPSASALAGEMAAHTCAACHGTQGRLGDEFFMPLAGMPVEQFVSTMIDFREGKRPSTLMGHVARGFTDEQLRAMGQYFAAVPPLGAEQGAQP